MRKRAATLGLISGILLLATVIVLVMTGDSSWANERPGVDAEWSLLFAFLRPWSRATQAERWAESERFGFCLDETTHPLKNLDTSDCRSVFKLVPNWSPNGSDHYPIEFEITGPGSCVVSSGSFHVQIVGSGFAEQKSQLRPRIRIDEPRANHALKPGDPLAIQWQVTKKPNHAENWEISVGLVNCGAGNRGLYSGAFSNDPGKLEWIPSAAEVTHPMETSWRIRVCLYDRKLGNDELRAMAMNCKAAATDNWLVCAYGSGSVRVVPK